MNREQLRAILERHQLVHDYLCSCGWESNPQIRHGGLWDSGAQWVDHVLAVEVPA